MEETALTFKRKFLRKLKAFGQRVLAFAKVNYLMLAYIVTVLFIELTAIAVTAGKFYMTEPWIYFTLIAFVCLISQYLPGHKSRWALFLGALVANFILDLIFTVVYDSTGGTVFDYAMLNLQNDAMTIVETLPFNFTLIFVSAVLIALYGVIGFMLRKYMPKPNVTRSAAITTSALAACAIGGNIMLSYFANYKYDSNDLSYMLFQTETGTYSNKGVVGNFYNEMVRGLWFSEINVGDEQELHKFVYASETEPTELYGEADGYNVVTILCESFEWFTFLFDAQRYPNGYARMLGTKSGDEKTIKDNLKKLFPNLYRIYESNSTVILNNAHSLNKTDISENESMIGHYPLYEYINYTYPTNDMPYSLPNVMKTLYGVTSKSFHNGYKTFYNRNEHHTKALGFESFTASEDMGMTQDDGVGERNLDSVMMETCKEQMFPTDRRFNTYVTTITQHGQYAYRDNLKQYYDKLDSYGLLPESDDSNANALRYYCAAGMDFDKALGIMLDYLEDNGLADKTLITLFGDHNTYYQGVSNYVKNIYSSDAPNYTELYRVPVMIKVGNRNLGRPVIEKFTCVCDIYPTILDLLGITAYSNLLYGVSAFDKNTTSILYSRAYGKFLTDKIYFNSLSNIIYQSADVNEAYIAEVERTARILLDKVAHINRIYAADFFKGARGDEFRKKLRIINEL